MHQILTFDYMTCCGIVARTNSPVSLLIRALFTNDAVVLNAFAIR